MNLSKTAKRFLSSTMAIALAGGSVLAFGNSALADSTIGNDTADAAVGFEGSVDAECSLTSTPQTSDEAYVADTGDTYTVKDMDNGAPGTDIQRTKILSANATVEFDCNTKSVTMTFPTATNTPPTGTGSGATNLTSTHKFEYDLNASGTNTVFTSATSETPDTDANGDLSVKITSTFTADGDELLAGTYQADATVQVVAR